MDAVCNALADPTRRELLDLLFGEDGQTLGALERHFSMTRFGVMKHLKALEEAKAVAGKQAELTQSKIEIEVAANRAEANLAEAQRNAKRDIAIAEGRAQAAKLEGEGEAAKRALKAAAIGYSLAILAPVIVTVLQGIVGADGGGQ